MKRTLPMVCAFILSACATLNDNDRAALERHSVSPALTARMSHGEPLAVPDIIELSRKGLPASFIIHYLRSTQAPYSLKVDDVTQLKNAGVSPDVINYLLATPAAYSPPNPYPPPFPPDPYYYSNPFVPGYPMHH